jgi:hypothetical protein
MQNTTKRKVNLILIGVFLFIASINSIAYASSALKEAKTPYYQIIIYHLKSQTQEAGIDDYLSKAYLPALHRSGVKMVGVFKSAGMDTAVDKRIYVLISYTSLSHFDKVTQLVQKDEELNKAGSKYLNAPYNDAPYLRKESILLRAFAGMPFIKPSGLTNPKSERIYELRSYEGATEYLSLNKIKMFNQEELEIFERIGSRPVFYAEVLAGSRMPNLMYLTTYKDRASREEQWKIFGSDPKWKRISALPEYQHNTTRSDITFLVPAEYSDL